MVGAPLTRGGLGLLLLTLCCASCDDGQAAAEDPDAGRGPGSADGATADAGGTPDAVVNDATVTRDAVVDGRVSDDAAPPLPDAASGPPRTQPPLPPLGDSTFESTWEPPRIGACDAEAPGSPVVALADRVLVEVGQRVMEPAILFGDETFTMVRRLDAGPSSVPLDWAGAFEVAGQEAAPQLYDDGSHGDLVAGDGLFTRACLSAADQDWSTAQYKSRYDMWFLNPALRGTEVVVDAGSAVRVNDTGFFISLGDIYATRRSNGWGLHGPETCVACQHAWSVAGDVFDFLVVGTRDAIGGAGYARVHDFIEGTGFEPPCPEKSHCYDLVDGKEHPEWMGVVWMPWPGVQGLNHELGHGLLGMETRGYPGPEDQEWNSGDGQHIDSDVTATGDLMGPFWDPDRGWPHAVVLEDEGGRRTETYLVRDEDGTFRLKPEDSQRYVWADIFLYMMGLLTAEEATTTYHKLVHPELTGCVAEEGPLVCPSANDVVTAEEVIEFSVAGLISQYGEWGTTQPFDPRNLRLGILNISDRRHTTAEITWFSLVYRDFATSEGPRGDWVDDTPWAWATRGLSAVHIDAQALTR